MSLELDRNNLALSIFEGTISELAFQADQSKSKPELQYASLLTSDCEEIKFCSNKFTGKKRLHPLIFIQNLKDFELFFQDNFNFLTKVKITTCKNKIIETKVLQEEVKNSSAYKETARNDNGININFPIHIICNNILSSRYQNAFNIAASRWSRIIVGGLPNSSMPINFSDGLIIKAFTSHIDGARNILGSTTPININAGLIKINAGLIKRNSAWMVLDSSDIHRMYIDGILADVVMHEIAHILGFGTLWADLGLIQGLGTNNPEFIGTNAMHEYAILRRSNQLVPVPIENQGGPGVRDCHWRESVFGSELMTSYVGDQGHPISRLTIASLKDIGYQVDLNSADSYNLKQDSENKFNSAKNSTLHCAII